MFGTRRSAICEPGQERVDAHEVDDHAALDLLDERAFDRLIVLVREADLLPHAHEVGFLLREDDRAFLILEVLEQDFDFVAGLEIGRSLNSSSGTLPSDLKPMSRTTMLSRISSTLALDDLAFVDRRHA